MSFFRGRALIFVCFDLFVLCEVIRLFPLIFFLLESERKKKNISWVSREVGRTWKELEENKYLVKIYCVKVNLKIHQKIKE